MALLKRRKNEATDNNTTPGDFSQRVIIGKAGRFDWLRKIPKRKMIIVLIALAVISEGLFLLYKYDKLGPFSPPRNTTPKPGDQIGPAPKEEKIPNFVPSDMIQVVPDGDGPDVPHEENKPAAAG